jgi:hypothetical protein
MRNEYKARYGLDFVSMLNCDEIGRYLEASPHRSEPAGVVSIVYSGSIGNGRWKSLIDVCEAVQTLRHTGIDVHIMAYVFDIPPDISAALRSFERVLTVADSLRNSDVPCTLKGADILLLLESFDEQDRKAVRLSIATKAHLYMMAQRPILVYGPSDAGVVRYAQRDGWAHVSTSKLALEKVMRSLAFDVEKPDEVIAMATEVALKNHNAASVRRRFAQLLREIS